ILMDDGIGPRLVKRLKSSLPHTSTNYETAWVGGLEILEYIQGFQYVIFIDGIKTKNGMPGDVYYFTPEDYKETLHLSNVHDVSFLTAIELGESLGYQLPESILIIAVEIEEDTVFGKNFTPKLSKRYNEIYQEIYQIIKPVVQDKITLDQLIVKKSGNP
ncbi:MAG: hydrogenase maturation protease, partial [Bacteroidales bacterium]|nr:hydrogenase maturation protease [Bacteroidales bacterium]